MGRFRTSPTQTPGHQGINFFFWILSRLDDQPTGGEDVAPHRMACVCGFVTAGLDGHDVDHCARPHLGHVRTVRSGGATFDCGFWK